MRWIPFPDDSLKVHGLHWFDPASPSLARLPPEAEDKVTPKVWDLSRSPGGGRIRFRSNTGELRIRFFVSRPDNRPRSGFDAYVDGEYWSSVVAREDGVHESTFFSGAERKERDVTLYLPLFQQFAIHQIGIDSDATIESSSTFSRSAPLVLYGSSIAQGVGAGRPAMSYQAILSRLLDLDYINLGFGGAGKAEPEMVKLLTEVDACCFLFDLGKSYGRQDGKAYTAMLETMRQTHPGTPMVCITPIHSTREQYDSDYRELSDHTRAVARDAVDSLRQTGDTNLHLIDGLQLLGPKHSDEFLEGVHPSDLGHWRMAHRLQEILCPLITSR
jgi:hypothetical protein